MTPTVILLTIAGYFCLLFIISFLVNRSKSGSYYGDKQTHWLVAAIAAMGAPISGVTFISVPGMVVTKGFSYLQMSLGFIIGYFIIAYVLIPLFYKKNLVSIYGYLGERFGTSTHKTGAWFFFVSKILGASVRFFVVCVVLQSLVFGPLGVPFVVNVLISVALICLYTSQGGVKTVIWTDTLKSFCLITSVVLGIIFIGKGLGFNFGGLFKAVAHDETSRIFFFDDPKSGIYFWKQFLSGIFMVIATTGLDQDLMQRSLSCKNHKDSQKSLIISVFTQVLIITLFLVLGTLLTMYYRANISSVMPEKTDELFGLVAASPGMPVIVGILFVVGLIAAAYSAAGSALTSLTTSFSIDILNMSKDDRSAASERRRKVIHYLMAVGMGLVIIVFYMISNSDAISAVYTLASYTYGPILGLFAFGMCCNRHVRDRWMPAVCIAAPLLCLLIKEWLFRSFGYVMSFELLLLNAALTMLGLFALSYKDEK